MHYGIEDATHPYTCIPLHSPLSLSPSFSLFSVLLKELLSLYLVLSISRIPSARFISSRMQHRPRHCAAETPWFLIISPIKVRFILSFFFTATNSSREARQYAQSRGMLAARSGKRQPNEFASERPRSSLCPEYYFHVIFTFTDTRSVSLCLCLCLCRSTSP